MIKIPTRRQIKIAYNKKIRKSGIPVSKISDVFFDTHYQIIMKSYLHKKNEEYLAKNMNVEAKS